MRNFLFSCLILISVVSSAQSYEAVEDSAELDNMRYYVEHILSLERDTLLADTLTHEYRIVYRTSCPYEEMAIPRSMEPDIYGYTSGKSFWYYDTPDSIYTKFPVLSQYPVDELYLCAENPQICRESSTLKLTQLKTGFNGTKTFIIGVSGSMNQLLGPFFHLCASFNQQEFMILECSYPLEFGNATNWGTTETFYLERVD